MRTLVIGDVHGCGDELRRLVDDAGPDRVVLVGDLFPKGPKPDDVWAQIRDGRWDAVLGNHDDRLLESVAGHIPEDVGAARCVERLNAADPSWLPWLRQRPLYLDVAGWTVVHAGLHPSGSLERTSRDMILTMRRWPPDQPNAPHWHQIYTGDRRLVFGHDAKRGLVRVERGGVPWLMGLDTGCVYGGKLTGYVLEEDRLFQVAAARQYKGFGGGKAK